MIRLPIYYFHGVVTSSMSARGVEEMEMVPVGGGLAGCHVGLVGKLGWASSDLQRLVLLLKPNRAFA
jgi:hypothetical protein